MIFDEGKLGSEEIGDEVRIRRGVPFIAVHKRGQERVEVAFNTVEFGSGEGADGAGRSTGKPEFLKNIIKR